MGDRLGPAGSRATSIQLILLRRSRPIPRKHTPGRTDMGKKIPTPET